MKYLIGLGLISLLCASCNPPDSGTPTYVQYFNQSSYQNAVKKCGKDNLNSTGFTDGTTAYFCADESVDN